MYYAFSIVHGGWSSWTQSRCSKSCGGGTVRFNRTCNNPTPSCRGLPCRGISFHEESCNLMCCRGKFIIVGYVTGTFLRRFKIIQTVTNHESPTL